jgi:hypothetical protein
VARLGIHAQLAAPRDVPAGLPRQPLDLVELRRLARRDDQQRLRHRRADALEGFEDRAFLSLPRAGGNHDGAIGSDAEIAKDAVSPAVAGRRSGELERVELEGPGDADALAVGADVDDAPGGLVALHAEAIDVAQHAAEERPRQAVARIRSCGNPPVDEQRLHSVARAGAQEVGPDFRLHHDEQPWPDQPQRAVDDEGEVERKVEHLVDVLQVVARDLLARHSGRGNEEPQLRVALAERGQQGARREHLADRHGVNPDRVVGVDIEGHGEIAQPLGQVCDVLPVPHRLVHEVRRHDKEKRDHDHAVDDVHCADLKHCSPSFDRRASRSLQ